LDVVSPQEFSAVVADAVASVPDGSRHALAAFLFESGAAGRLVAAVAEQCGELYGLTCTPQAVHDTVRPRSERHRVWQRVESVLGAIPANHPECTPLTNLLAALFNSEALTTVQDVDRAVRAWCETRRLLDEVA
jgi:hypothetical protein